MRAIPSVCLAAVAAGLLLLPRHAAAQSQPDANALQQQIDQLKKEFGERIAALEAKLAEAQAPRRRRRPSRRLPRTGYRHVRGAVGERESLQSRHVRDRQLRRRRRQERPQRRAAIRLERGRSRRSRPSSIRTPARISSWPPVPRDVEVEEGFITFNTLPGRTAAESRQDARGVRQGQPLHTHRLPWADRPLVTQNLVGGEEGISTAGRVAVAI